MKKKNFWEKKGWKTTWNRDLEPRHFCGFLFFLFWRCWETPFNFFLLLHHVVVSHWITEKFRRPSWRRRKKTSESCSRIIIWPLTIVGFLASHASRNSSKSTFAATFAWQNVAAFFGLHLRRSNSLVDALILVLVSARRVVVWFWLWRVRQKT